VAQIKARIDSTISRPQQVSVTMPAGAQSQTAVTNSTLKLRLLNDVDASQLKDGSMIQYSSSSDKFVVRDEITTTTGSITLNGGNF
jgi:hypothetical protein|tara:strand:- start:520 stop:777 length:258 start_codon:yes stop_codon:yes gene_type:complete